MAENLGALGKNGGNLVRKWGLRDFGRGHFSSEDGNPWQTVVFDSGFFCDRGS